MQLKPFKEPEKGIHPACKRNMCKSATLQTLKLQLILSPQTDSFGCEHPAIPEGLEIGYFSLDSNVFYFQQKALSKFLSIISFHFHLIVFLKRM